MRKGVSGSGTVFFIIARGRLYLGKRWGERLSDASRRGVGITGKGFTV